MRLLHTADWHLGRSLHGVRLLDDQAYALDQLLAIARDCRPDAVVIAGDVYDRSVPPGEAIELLDEILARLILDLRLPVILIAGNHDGPQLVDFGSRLFTAQRLFTFGTLGTSLACVTLMDADGPVHLYPLPYAEPLVMRQRLGDDTIVCHDTAMRGWVRRVVQQHPTGEPACPNGLKG